MLWVFSRSRWNRAHHSHSWSYTYVQTEPYNLRSMLLASSDKFFPSCADLCIPLTYSNSRISQSHTIPSETCLWRMQSENCHQPPWCSRSIPFWTHFLLFLVIAWSDFASQRSCSQALLRTLTLGYRKLLVRFQLCSCLEAQTSNCQPLHCNSIFHFWIRRPCILCAWFHGQSIKCPILSENQWAGNNFGSGLGYSAFYSGNRTTSWSKIHQQPQFSSTPSGWSNSLRLAHRLYCLLLNPAKAYFLSQKHTTRVWVICAWTLRRSPPLQISFLPFSNDSP